MNSKQKFTEPVFLNFQLPPIIRESWVSQAVRQTWSPTLREVSLSLIKAAISAAAEGHIRLEQRRIPGWQIFQVKAIAERLNVPIDITVADETQGISRPPLLFYNVTYGRDLPIWLASGQSEKAGKLMPSCCLAANENSVWRYKSPWHSAKATQEAKVDAGAILIKQPPGMNTLWRMFGLSILAYNPCKFDCTESLGSLEFFLDYLKICEKRQAMEQLLEILDWPVEWSALHGIAELKTPIVKYAMTTDSTAQLCTVRWLGNSYPKEGANGKTFPYNQLDRLRATRYFSAA